MIKYTNEYGKECYKDVTMDSLFSADLFHEVPDMLEPEENFQYALHTNLGSITVVDRLTGFMGYVRDVETGYRDPDGRFWLASGNMDVRQSGANTIGEVIDWVKHNANTCVGV